MATGTVRTIAELYALYDDNTSGQISPQDLRDFVATVESLAPSIPVHRAISGDGLAANAAGYYLLGMYDTPAAEAVLNQAGATQAYGTANSSYASHAIVVAKQAGATDGTNLILTVSGTSITDAGVRTGGDSQVVVSDCTGASTDAYYETSKKWIGPVVYTLTSDGGTFDFSFNYGWASYHDNGNTNFNITGCEFEWFGNANDSDLDVQILKHTTTGWTYSAAAFVPGGTPLYSSSAIHSTESEVVAGDYGRFKMSGISDAIAGAGSEGVLVRFITGTNNSLEWLNGTVNILPTV